jgi:hypothetical protein
MADERWIANSRLIRPDGRIVLKGDPVPALPATTLRILWRAGHIRRADETAPDPQPVTVVPGIGPERARGLAAMGITSLSELAAADPVEIEAGMVNVSLAMVEGWRAHCRELIYPAMTHNQDSEVEVNDGRAGSDDAKATGAHGEDRVAGAL